MTKTQTYEHLAQPIRIGQLELKNRFMKNATGFFWDDRDNGSYMDDRTISYFDALARGGAALISSATGPLTRDVGAPMPGYKVLSDDYIPGWRRWVDTVHGGGALAFHALFHLGPMTPLFGWAPPGIAASAIPKEISPRPGFTVPRAATKEEIEDVVDMFASAAERMQRAGFDGTEINGACNHFLDTFLSRAWNKRDDEYGCQTIASRTRPFVSVIKEIKRRNGADWPIIALFNGAEVDLEDGITVDEAQQFAQAFVAAGADALEVRIEYYTWTDRVDRRQSLHFPDIYCYPERTSTTNPYVDIKQRGAGASIPVAAAIKQVVDVPIITVGKLDQDLGEQAVAAGKIDIISLNRRLFADPELPNKVLSGRVEDINVCNSCMTCFDECEHFRPVRCRVNASFGKEREYAIELATMKKRVLVIGGGPAGMETARVAALRGHDVTLVEKQGRLGGSMVVASVVKGDREDLMGTVAYLSTQLKKAGVKIQLGKAADAKLVDALRPDVIVVAAGGTHDIPQIPGIDGKNVLTGEELHARVKSALRVAGPRTLRALSMLPIANRLMIGQRVVIMGGRLHGCQTAEYLVHQGKEVTIVDTGTAEEIGEGMLEVFMKPYLLWWLEDHGVKFVTEIRYKAITDKGLVVTGGDGGEQLIEADTVITALPLLPNSRAQAAFSGKAAETYTIGDAAEPHLIVDAIAAGATTARAF